MVHHIAALGELSALLPDTLLPVAAVIIEALQVLVILKMAGLPDHVLAVFLRSMNSGNEVKLIQVFRQLLDRHHISRSRHQDHRVQLFLVRFVQRRNGPAHLVQSGEIVAAQVFQIQGLRRLFRQLIEVKPHLSIMQCGDPNPKERPLDLPF